MKIAVVGLGYFGFKLAQNLARRRMEVIAVDRDPELVARIASEIDHAVAFDSTDLELLREQGIHEVDVLIVAIGENREGAILTAANGLELGIPRVIARASGPVQEMILRRIGAHEVFDPEERAADQLATRLASPNLLEQLPLTQDWCVIRVATPAEYVGKTLAELDLRRTASITVLGIAPPGEPENVHLSPGGNVRIREQEELILLGRTPTFEQHGFIR